MASPQFKVVSVTTSDRRRAPNIPLPAVPRVVAPAGLARAASLLRERGFRRILAGSIIAHGLLLTFSVVVGWQTPRSAATESLALPAVVALPAAPTPTVSAPPAAAPVSRLLPVMSAPVSRLVSNPTQAVALPPGAQTPGPIAPALAQIAQRVAPAPVSAPRAAMPQRVLPHYDAAVNPPPAYPRVARQHGWEGTTVLEVEVAPNGRARTVTVSASSGHGLLDRAAAAAVRGWRFSPGRIGDTAVAMLVQIPVVFRLADG